MSLYDQASLEILMIVSLSSRAVAGFCAALLLLQSLTPIVADPPVRKITVIGTANIKVVPDEMNWTVQVSTNDTTLARAKDRHDASLTAALAYVKSLGDAVKDLQTGGIRIDKMNYAPQTPSALEKPFTCTTQFTFTLTDFDKYGPIADACSKLDAVWIQSVDYASSKAEATKSEALKQALQNAHDKASELAVTAGCYIDKPLEILEGTPEIGPRPMMMSARSANFGGGTPAAVPGEIEIGGTVTATYDLFYK